MITIRVTRARPPGWPVGSAITVRPLTCTGRPRSRTPARGKPAGAHYPVRVPLYAAYGSNMDPAQMKERAPHSPMAGTGWLPDWRLTFGGEDYGWEGALSTIVESPGSQVFCVLYDVSPEDERELDHGTRQKAGTRRPFPRGPVGGKQEMDVERADGGGAD